MIYCTDPIFKTAKIGDEFRSAVVTELRTDESYLSNSLEYTAWQRDLVLPFICDCLQPYCDTSGLARIVRMKDGLLWRQPTPQELSCAKLYEHEQSALKTPVFMPHATWERLRGACEKVPPTD